MGEIFVVFKRVMSQGAIHEEACDLTEQSSPRKHEPPRCLNYLTSPPVVLGSAVAALCAFAGLFEAQELMVKDSCEEIVLYRPPFHLDPDKASGSSVVVECWQPGD
ncbi:unnamed protein product [Camellia sinensis]